MAWKIKRIKDVVKVNELTLSESTNPNYEFDYIDIGSINQFKITETETTTFLEAPSRARRIVRKNDILVSTVRTYLKAITFIDFLPKDVIASTGFAVLTSKKGFNCKFLSYAVEADYFIDDVIKNSVGTSYPAIKASKLEALSIILPQIETQQKIADFLDEKTQNIDRRLELLQKKNEYYATLRKAIINEAVNGEAKNWKRLRVKDLFEIGRGRVIGQELLQENGNYPVYSSQTENNGCLGYIDTFDFEGDYLTWTTDGVNAGTVFKRNGQFNCTNVCGTLKQKKNNCNLTFMYYALSVEAQHNKRIDTNGAKIMNNEMAVISLPFPDLSEQIKIATYLDKKTSTIDSIVEKITEEIDSLKIYRRALINEAVTGKLKIE